MRREGTAGIRRSFVVVGPGACGCSAPRTGDRAAPVDRAGPSRGQHFRARSGEFRVGSEAYRIALLHLPP